MIIKHGEQVSDHPGLGWWLYEVVGGDLCDDTLVLHLDYHMFLQFCI